MGRSWSQEEEIELCGGRKRKGIRSGKRKEEREIFLYLGIKSSIHKRLGHTRERGDSKDMEGG